MRRQQCLGLVRGDGGQHRLNVRQVGRGVGRTTMASFGSGSDVQTILLASRLTMPPSIMAVRLRSKSVARSTLPEETAISLAAWVAPSRYCQNAFGSIFQISRA